MGEPRGSVLSRGKSPWQWGYMGVYRVMPKINVYLPDELAEAVKATGVPVSAVCQRALEEAVKRMTALREVDPSALDLDDPNSRLARLTTARVREVIKLAAARARDEG